jgi:hypothetical protein
MRQVALIQPSRTNTLMDAGPVDHMDQSWMQSAGKIAAIAKEPA